MMPKIRFAKVKDNLTKISLFHVHTQILLSLIAFIYRWGELLTQSCNTLAEQYRDLFSSQLHNEKIATCIIRIHPKTVARIQTSKEEENKLLVTDSFSKEISCPIKKISDNKPQNSRL